MQFIRIVKRHGRSLLFHLRDYKEQSFLRVGALLTAVIILPLGSYLQQIFVAAFDTHQTSIVEAAYGASSVSYTISEPYETIWMIGFLIIGISSFFSIRNGSTLKSATFSISLVFFFGLTALDVIGFFIYRNDGLGVSVLANLLGASLVALLYAIVVSVSHRLGSNEVRSAAPISYASVGLLLVLVSCVFSAAYTALMVPIAVKVYAEAYAPTQVYYANPPIDEDIEEEEFRRMSFVGPVWPEESAKGMYFTGEAPHLNYSSLSKHDRSEVEISFFSDCITSDSRNLPKNDFSLKFSDISKISIGSNGVVDRVVISSPQYLDVDWADSVFGLFWVSEDARLDAGDAGGDITSEEGERVSTFLNKPESVRLVSQEELTILWQASVYKSEGDGENRVSGKAHKNLTLQIDEWEKDVTVQPKVAEFTDQILDCRPISVDDAASVAAALTLKISLKVHPNKGALRERFGSSEFTVDHGSLWLTDVNPDMFDGRSFGYLSFVAIPGGVSFVEVNGTPIKFPNDETVIWARGELEGRYQGRAKFVVAGDAHYLWTDQKRLNPTIWERLSSEERLWLLGALGALLITLGRLLFPILRSDWKVQLL